MSGTILLIEKDIPTRQRLTKALTQARYRVVTGSRTSLPTAAFASQSYDLVLIGIDGERSRALELCAVFKEDPETRYLPILAIVPSWAQGGAACFANGVEDVLLRDIEDAALLARVRSQIRMRLVHDELGLRDETARDLGTILTPPEEDRWGTVLIAANAAKQAIKWASALRGHDVHVVRRMSDIFEADLRPEPDVIVMHQDFSAGSGLAGIVEIRSQLVTRHTPILFVPKTPDSAGTTLALDLGASDYVHAPVADDELRARVAALVRRNRLGDRLRKNLRERLQSAFTDPLTGLYNRRYALAHLGRQLDLARSSGTPLSVMMLDIDRFKSINDTYGHAAGDTVLRDVAGRILASVRSVDLVARIGGEEFLLIMPGALADEADRVAQRIRRYVRGAGAQIPLAESEAVTLSAGIAVACNDLSIGAEGLLERADRALYASKESGRDRVSVHEAA